MLYSSEAPAGRIFTGADAIAAAKENGWVDTPTAIKEVNKRESAGGKGKTAGASK